MDRSYDERPMSTEKKWALGIGLFLLLAFFVVSGIFAWIAFIRKNAAVENCPPVQLRCTGVCDDGVTPTTIGVQICKYDRLVEIFVSKFSCDATAGSADTLGLMQCKLPQGSRTNSSFGSVQGYFSANVAHDGDHQWPSTVAQWTVGGSTDAAVPFVQDLPNGDSYLVFNDELYDGTLGTNAVWGPPKGFNIRYVALN